MLTRVIFNALTAVPAWFRGVNLVTTAVEDSPKIPTMPFSSPLTTFLSLPFYSCLSASFIFLTPAIPTKARRFRRIRIAFTVSTPQPWRSPRNLPIRPSPASSPLLPPPLGRWSPPPAWKPCRAGPILWRPQGRPGRSRCIRRSTTLLVPSVASPAAASLTWPLPRSTLSSAICKWASSICVTRGVFSKARVSINITWWPITGIRLISAMRFSCFLFDSGRNL